MRRPIIINGNPYIHDYYMKDTTTLFNDTGGNSGNLAFRYAVSTHFRTHVPMLHLGMPPQALRAQGDVIVLPLANQLGAHTDLGRAAEELETIGLPVIGIGLGAQAKNADADIQLTPGTMRWLETLVKLAPSEGPNLGVRGSFTQQQIGKLGLGSASVVTGCPSNFINLTSDLAAILESKYDTFPERIAVSAGIPHAAELAAIEQNLARLISATEGAYIVQHGLEMLQLARGEFDAIKPGLLDLCHGYIRPDLSMTEFKAWCRRHAIAFYNACGWMDYLKRFDFVIGTRIHGAMLAVQAGTPAGVIAHDSRTYEMCDAMAIPVVRAAEITEEITQENLRDLFRFDASEYRFKRFKSAQCYRKMYHDAEIEVNPLLEAI